MLKARVLWSLRRGITCRRWPEWPEVARGGQGRPGEAMGGQVRPGEARGGPGWPGVVRGGQGRPRVVSPGGRSRWPRVGDRAG